MSIEQTNATVFGNDQQDSSIKILKARSLNNSYINNLFYQKLVHSICLLNKLFIISKRLCRYRGKL